MNFKCQAHSSFPCSHCSNSNRTVQFPTMDQLEEHRWAQLLIGWAKKMLSSDWLMPKHAELWLVETKKMLSSDWLRQKILRSDWLMPKKCWALVGWGKKCWDAIGSGQKSLAKLCLGLNGCLPFLKCHPLVPDAHYSEHQDKPFSWQIQQLESGFKDKLRIFIFCTLRTNGLIKKAITQL